MRPRDRRGRDVHVGDRVTYNYSGDVAIGEVVRISRGGTIHVRMDDECRPPKPGHVSKVKSGRSVLVLAPADTDTGLCHCELTAMDAGAAAVLCLDCRHAR